MSALERGKVLVIGADRSLEDAARRLAAGDVILGLASTGVHSNGFSLVRRIVADRAWDLHQHFASDRTLGEALLEPTRIYVRSLLPLVQGGKIKGLAHITP